MKALECVDGIFPAILHSGEADHIKALERMSAMRWISENDDVVGASIFQKGMCVVGAVAVQDQHTCAAFRLVSSLFIEVLLDPLACKASICPTVRRMPNPALRSVIQSHCHSLCCSRCICNVVFSPFLHEILSLEDDCGPQGCAICANCDQCCDILPIRTALLVLSLDSTSTHNPFRTLT